MMNRWQNLQKLVSPQTQTALVVTVNDDGTSVCTTALGTTLVLTGDIVSAGDMCLYNQYNTIIGKASILYANSIFLHDIDYGYLIYSVSETIDFGSVTGSVDCLDTIDNGSVA